jgi:FtsP/CotA-like multicopper oxidase with cupredoxin domain
MNPFSTVFYVPFLCLVQWVCNTAATGNGLNTVRFEITVTWEDWEVAGAVRKTILTNGQFPAPKLQLKQGDNVEFMINNWLPFPTAIHFHGELSLFPAALRPR